MRAIVKQFARGTPLRIPSGAVTTEFKLGTLTVHAGSYVVFAKADLVVATPVGVCPSKLP